jgi:hypothetical protein
MPVASLLRDRFLALLATGAGDLDWSALAALASGDAGEPSSLLAASSELFEARPARTIVVLILSPTETDGRRFVGRQCQAV